MVICFEMFKLAKWIETLSKSVFLIDVTVDLHQEAPQQKEEAASTDNAASAPSNSVDECFPDVPTVGTKSNQVLFFGPLVILVPLCSILQLGPCQQLTSGHDRGRWSEERCHSEVGGKVMTHREIDIVYISDII